MSKNWDDMINEEKIDHHRDARTHHGARAAMLEQLSIMFVNRAGEFFKRGNDSGAQEFRELSIEMTEMAKVERKSQSDIKEKIEALEKQDAPADPSP